MQSRARIWPLAWHLLAPQMSLHRSAPSLAMPLSTHGACIAAVPSQPRAPHASSAIPEHHINHAVPPNRVCPILLTRISRTHRTDHQHGARLPRCEECQLASQHSLIAPLEDVNVTDVKRGSLRNGDLAIVKEHLRPETTRQRVGGSVAHGVPLAARACLCACVPAYEVVGGGVCRAHVSVERDAPSVRPS